jgi:hypothetical protein
MIHAIPAPARARAAVLPTVGTIEIIAPVRQVLRSVVQALFDPYRPELHYMRGPGPKCREKQALSERGL